MKTFFIWMMVGLSVCTNMAAQGFGGRGGYGGGGYRGNRGNPGEMRNQSQSLSKDYSQIRITNFPKIAGLTLKQDLGLTTAVTDEQKNMLRLSDQKQELQVKIEHAKNQKDIDKNTKKAAKLDDEIQNISQKTDKKIQSILTNDQYKEFMEKKDQIKFGMLPTFRSGFRSNPNRMEDGNQGRMERPEE